MITSESCLQSKTSVSWCLVLKGQTGDGNYNERLRPTCMSRLIKRFLKCRPNCRYFSERHSFSPPFLFTTFIFLRPLLFSSSGNNRIYFVFVSGFVIKVKGYSLTLPLQSGCFGTPISYPWSINQNRQIISNYNSLGGVNWFLLLLNQGRIKSTRQ